MLASSLTMKFLVILLSLFSLALSSDPYSTAATTRRERNLDHLNPETLAYYLGIHPTTLEPVEDAEYVGFDVAVMFFAQWDQNSHNLAPYWDNIGVKLGAGSKQSKLIMGLFDCELDYQHSQICVAAGVNVYPTMLFIGAGPYQDTDPITRVIGKDRSAGPAGAAPLSRTVKFQGNWMYTDSIKDWIRTMQGLSAWHRWTTQGFLKNVRKGLLGFLQSRRKNESSTSLPVGVPVVGGSVSMAQTSFLESQLEVVEKEGKLMEKAATHASLLLDNVLFPPQDKDPFVELQSNGYWDKTISDPEVLVLRTCVIELSLDYCSRLSTHITGDFLKEFRKGVEEQYESMEEVEIILNNQLIAAEPYCGFFDACYAEDFASEACRPATCPFQQVGCSYLTACFDELVQTEYAIALELIEEGGTFPPPKKAVEEESPASKAKQGGWGFF